MNSISPPEVQQSQKARYDAYLKSHEWEVKRIAAIERAGHKCQICSSTDRLHVHHNSYEHLGNEPDCDLVALCNGCHLLYEVRLRPWIVKPKKRESPCGRKGYERDDGYVTRVKVDREFIDSLRTKRGGMNGRSLAVLGLTWPVKKGWYKPLLGKELVISSDELRKVREGSGRRECPPSHSESYSLSLGSPDSP
jgi:hypothetical protein